VFGGHLHQFIIFNKSQRKFQRHLPHRNQQHIISMRIERCSSPRPDTLKLSRPSSSSTLMPTFIIASWKSHSLVNSIYRWRGAWKVKKERSHCVKDSRRFTASANSSFRVLISSLTRTIRSTRNAFFPLNENPCFNRPFFAFIRAMAIQYGLSW
jgi:hypothetical protein